MPRTLHWEERRQVLSKILAGELTRDQGAQQLKVSKASIVRWLGSAGKEVKAREKEQAFQANFKRVFAWMVENGKFKYATACGSLAIPYGSFIQHLREHPDLKARVGEADSAARKAQVAAMGFEPLKVHTKEELAQMHEETRAMQAELRVREAEMDRLLDKLNRAVTEHQESRE